MTKTKPLESWRLPSARMTMEAILSEVEAAFGYDRGTLQKRDKSARVSWARQVAMALGNDAAGLSQREIGRVLERDHGTVSYARQVVRSLISVHPPLKAEYDRLMARIQAKINTPT